MLADPTTSSVNSINPQSSSDRPAELSEPEQAAYERLPQHLKPEFLLLRQGLRSAAQNSIRARLPSARRILAVRDASRKGRKDVRLLAVALGEKPSTLYSWARVAWLFSDEDIAEILRRPVVRGRGFTWSHAVLIAELADSDVVDIDWRDALVDRVLTEGLSTTKLSKERDAFRPNKDSDEETDADAQSDLGMEPDSGSKLSQANVSPFEEQVTDETSPEAGEFDAGGINPYEYADAEEGDSDALAEAAEGATVSPESMELSAVRGLLNDAQQVASYLRLEELEPAKATELGIRELEDSRLAWLELSDLARCAAEKHAVALDALRQRHGR